MGNAFAMEITYSFGIFEVVFRGRQIMPLWKLYFLN